MYSNTSVKIIFIYLWKIKPDGLWHDTSLEQIVQKQVGRVLMFVWWQRCEASEAATASGQRLRLLLSEDLKSPASSSSSQLEVLERNCRQAGPVAAAGWWWQTTTGSGIVFWCPHSPQYCNIYWADAQILVWMKNEMKIVLNWTILRPRVWPDTQPQSSVIDYFRKVSLHGLIKLHTEDRIVEGKNQQNSWRAPERKLNIDRNNFRREEFRS